ncbi:superoxide dismutase family protein [Virgibacillus siamensis]|uniref:superoxide dismutase family protein n=1 Tax=Virgibacillus siamensis TaxID=480071 RepID=UPI0009844147|nr:superoxide dismutase family protein [Virgibacillus siamensis]
MRVLLIMFLLVLTACSADMETARTVEMYNAGGDMIGTAKLTEQPEGVQVKLKLEGLEAGFHGIHVHEYPKCKGPDFKSAGSHFNPEGKEHGPMNPEGAHLGDLPNILADSGGLADAELLLPKATLLDGKNSLIEGGGTSLVITAGQDDGVSQPGGDSGPRIACGVISNKDKNPGNSPTDPTMYNEKQKEK